MSLSIVTRKKLFPSWLFVFLNVVYSEALLYIWSCDSFQIRQLLPAVLFAVGLGGVLSFLICLIPGKILQKTVAVILSLAISVFWITEFFVADAYKVFMSPKLILGGAGGVATDFFDLVVSLLLGNWWKIIVFLLPLVFFFLFGTCPECGKCVRIWMVSLALAGYLAGFAAVYCVDGNLVKWTRAFDFDSAVHNYGLQMALILESQQGGDKNQMPDFSEPVAIITEPTQAPTQEPETLPETTEPEVVYGENVLGTLDFNVLAQETKNTGVASVHRYVAAQTPSKQNEYTGLFAGKNLILVTAEAFTAQVIDPELTPTLYRMATEGIEFTDYYQPAWGASTTGGEFSNLMGLVPTTGGMCMKEVLQQDMFVTMGKQLQKLGYMSAAYHNHHYSFYDRHMTHTEIGYDKFEALHGGTGAVFPESDLEMVQDTIGDYLHNGPFSIYYMTVSGHSTYTYDSNYQSRKNYEAVENLPYSETIKCYLAAQLEFEYSMKFLIEQLEEAGIADDTVIVISADHYPYGLKKSQAWRTNKDYLPELYDVEEYDFQIRDKNALIIWSGCLEDMDLKVETPVYSLDILPTLSNLFGLEYDSRLLIGRDVFSQQDPLVLWPNTSWRTEKGTYDADRDVFTPTPGEEIPEGYVEYMTAVVENKITYSRSVQDLNYFGILSKLIYPVE